MTTQYLVIGLVVAFLIGGGIFYSMQSSPSSNSMTPSEQDAMNMEADSTHMADDAVMMQDESVMGADGSIMETEMTMESGRYELYTADKITQASKGPVVLFFRASWCPTCQAVDADIRKNAHAIPTGTVILEVDYDNSAELKREYGVTYQHTFIQVDAAGALVTKWSGSPTLAALLPNIKK